MGPQLYRGRRRLATLAPAVGGNVSLLFAAALAMLVGTSALGIDAGTLFLEKRRLQGIADAAALAAAADPTAANGAVQATIAANHDQEAGIGSITIGSYTADPARAPADRFGAGGMPGNAVKVALVSKVPTFFSRVFTGERSTVVNAHATAARIDLAAFSIGSRLAAVQGGLPNALLSGLVGTELSLSVSDYNALLSGKVDVLQFSEALRTSLGLDAATFGDTLKTRVSLPQVARAMAVATGDAAAAAALRSLSGRLPPISVTLAEIIDLGPLAGNVHADPARAVPVDGFAMLRAAIELASPTRQVATDLALDAPGLASAKLILQIGERPAHSPWLAVGAADQVTIRTAQTRLLIDVTLAGAVAGVGTVRLPVFVELASAEARLSDVSCAQGRDKATATLDVTPSVGNIAIADVNTSVFADFRTPVALRPAQIAKAPLIAVTGLADLHLGGVAAQSVNFTAADIAEQRVQTVSTNDIVRGVATSLLEKVDLKASVAGLGIGGGAVAAAVGAALAQVAGPIDALIASVTGLAGVHVGQADVWVNGVRCGTPILVA